MWRADRLRGAVASEAPGTGEPGVTSDLDRPARLPEIVSTISLSGIIRIDAGLEGDWSGTVVPVWTRDEGLIGFDRVARSHPEHRPSLELYYDGAWVGIHCFQREGDRNIFDEDLARAVVRWVDSNC